jgi:protein NUD1
MLCLDDCYEVRKLFLSGNKIQELDLKRVFLNLQYLEIASAGLQKVPHDMGIMMPNLRTLNLNYNAISDITPLVGMIRLRKLLVVGNRLSRLRKSANVLSSFGHLGTVDMRNNPLTIGFYPPIMDDGLAVRDNSTDIMIREPHEVASADKEKDEPFKRLLDIGTQLRRRLYEMLVVQGGSTKKLDGLEVDRTTLLQHDDVWRKLVDMGILIDTEEQQCAIADDHRGKIMTLDARAAGANVDAQHEVVAPNKATL